MQYEPSAQYRLCGRETEDRLGKGHFMSNRTTVVQTPLDFDEIWYALSTTDP